jgi:hypothetical protein
LQIVKKYESSFIDEAVVEFPLEPHQRRWYDESPYLWIMFNGLQKAAEKILDEIAAYLEKILKTET